MNSKTKKQKLNMKYPFLTVYPHHANLLAVAGNNPYDMPAFLNRMIGIIYNREIERADFNVGYEILPYIKNYPLCYSHGISRSVVSRHWKTFSSFLTDMLDDGYYIHCLVDTWFIRAYTETFGKSHYSHNIIIYGYDKSLQIFYGADAFEKGKYSFREMEFKEMDAAFFDSHIDDWLDGILLFRLKEDPFLGIGYDINYIREQCDRFLHGTYEKSSIPSPMAKEPDDERFCYGIRVYDEVCQYLNLIHEEERAADIRIFSLLSDHARVFLYLTEQLAGLGQIRRADEIYERFQEIVLKFEELSSRVIKYNMASSSERLGLIRERLHELKMKMEQAVRLFSENILIKAEAENRMVGGVIPAVHMAVDYKGNWKRKSCKESSCGVPVYMETKEDGAYASLQFYGDSVEIYFSESGRGTTDILLDGEIPDAGKISSVDLEHGIRQYRLKNLEEGYHTVKVQALGKEGNHRLSLFRFVAGKENIADEKLSVEESVSEAEFLGIDKSSCGNWKGKYGTDGFEVIGDMKRLPDYVGKRNYVYRNGVYILLMRTTGDRRALECAGHSGRIVACYLRDTEFSLEMTVSGRHQVTFYFVDYERFGRGFTIVAEDAATGKGLEETEVLDCSDGVYVKYRVSGYVRFRFIRETGPDALLSGVFFD